MDGCDGTAEHESRRCTSRNGGRHTRIANRRRRGPRRSPPDNFRDVVFAGKATYMIIPSTKARFRRRRQARDRQSRPLREKAESPGGVRAQARADAGVLHLLEQLQRPRRRPRRRVSRDIVDTPPPLIAPLVCIHTRVSSSSSTRDAPSPSTGVSRSRRAAVFKPSPRLRTPPRVDGRSRACRPSSASSPSPHRRRSRFSRPERARARLQGEAVGLVRALPLERTRSERARALEVKDAVKRDRRAERLDMDASRRRSVSLEYGGRGELRAERDARFEWVQAHVRRVRGARGATAHGGSMVRGFGRREECSWWRCTMDTVETR